MADYCICSNLGKNDIYLALSSDQLKLRASHLALGFTYDALNRVTREDRPNGESAVTYQYDNYNDVTQAAETGSVLTNLYDGLGRLTTASQPFGSASISTIWRTGGRG